MASGWSAPSPASASTTLDVNSTLDVVDASPGDGVCETAPGNGECTLRAALMEANHAPGGGATVNVPAGTYLLTIPNGAAPDEAQGDLDITANTEVAGAGAETTIVDANGAVIQDRVLQVGQVITVTVAGVTLQHGMVTSPPGQQSMGGGILSEGSLTLDSVVVHENQAGIGGGILQYPPFNGTLTVRRSEITENTALSYAGGVFVGYGHASLTDSLVGGNTAVYDGGGVAAYTGETILLRSTVTNNEAGDYGGGFFVFTSYLTLVETSVSGNSARGGGGIYNSTNSNVPVHIFRSTISANIADWGGGIFNAYGAVIENSTLSGNRADEDGGAILLGDNMHLVNSTIRDNYADYDLDGVGSGGGINGGQSPYEPIAFQNSLIAGNYESEFDGANWVPVIGDCAGALTSLGYNLMQAYSPDCTINGGGVTLADPLLGPLAYNGGPTQTHALLPGSPAIDGGNPAGCLDADGLLIAADQRGVFRHAGGRCDIGAFEYHAYTYYLPILAR